jgi:hypothetical protein
MKQGSADSQAKMQILRFALSKISRVAHTSRRFLPRCLRPCGRGTDMLKNGASAPPAGQSPGGLAQTPSCGVCDVPKGHARVGSSIQPVHT